MSDTADGPLSPERLAKDKESSIYVGARVLDIRTWMARRGPKDDVWITALDRAVTLLERTPALIAEIERLRADALTAEEAETILLFRWNSPRREVALTDKLQRIAHPAAGQ